MMALLDHEAIVKFLDRIIVVDQNAISGDAINQLRDLGFFVLQKMRGREVRPLRGEERAQWLVYHQNEHIAAVRLSEVWLIEPREGLGGGSIIRLKNGTVEAVTDDPSTLIAQIRGDD